MSEKAPGVGVGVLLLKEGKVLLGKRNSDPEKLTPNFMEKELGLYLEVK